MENFIRECLPCAVSVIFWYLEEVIEKLSESPTSHPKEILSTKLLIPGSSLRNVSKFRD